MARHPHRDSLMREDGDRERLDPTDIANPVSAYFFLSDDAQDKISGSNKKRMKCLSCGHTFRGEIYDRCPECFGADTEDVADENDDGYCRSRLSLPDGISKPHPTDLS